MKTLGTRAQDQNHVSAIQTKILNPGGVACSEELPGTAPGLSYSSIEAVELPDNNLWTVVELHLSPERLQGYLAVCDGNLDRALELYLWNSTVSAAISESLGHLEIGVRNALSRQLTLRHNNLGRSGTWLDDPADELTLRARTDILDARSRVAGKGKSLTHPQIVSELSFGFWRYLISKRNLKLWPDLAGGFPNAPNRSLKTVEDPLIRLLDLRNRIAHHQRIWNLHLEARIRDLEDLLGYIDADFRDWVLLHSRVPSQLAARPPHNRHK
jgi:hypothetical protein